MSSVVLDASAVLAALKGEAGAARVADALAAGAIMSTVNLAEVVSTYSAAGVPDEVIRELLDEIPIEIAAFDLEQGVTAGFLRPRTRSAGLSLGDRACLALAQARGLRVLTADRAWAGLSVGIEIDLIR